MLRDQTPSRRSNFLSSLPFRARGHQLRVVTAAEVRSDEIKTRAAQLTDQLGAATAQNLKLVNTVT